MILTVWSTVLLEKLPFLSYSRYHLPSMETEGSLPCSQQQATGPYIEPDASNPHPLIYA
jgi:hypothetical protein